MGIAINPERLAAKGAEHGEDISGATIWSVIPLGVIRKARQTYES
jgi:hypothetical protein